MLNGRNETTGVSNDRWYAWQPPRRYAARPNTRPLDAVMNLWERTRGFASDAGAVVAGEGFARLTSFLAIPIAALFLSDAELGRVALGLLAFTFVSVLFNFGLGGPQRSCTLDRKSVV